MNVSDDEIIMFALFEAMALTEEFDYIDCHDYTGDETKCEVCRLLSILTPEQHKLWADAFLYFSEVL